MSKRNNKIAVRKFAEVVDTNNVVEIPLMNVEGVNIEIKKTISFQDMIAFVESVVELCIDKESGEYIPQIRDFAIKRELLTKYANFTLPQSVEKAYEYIYNSEVVNLVLSHINQVQFSEIVSSVDSKIRYTLDNVNSAAISSVTSLIAKLDSAVDESSAMFDGIEHDDVINMMKNMDVIASKDEYDLARGVKQAVIDNE